MQRGFQGPGSRTLWEEGGSSRARLAWRAAERRGQVQVMPISVDHAGAGQTHAGCCGEGQPAAGLGCHEGKWSHTDTRAFKVVQPRHTVPPKGSPSSHQE